ncbi:hypothetical protein BaRGS_00019960, partial [Batillaria attramentaria]
MCNPSVLVCLRYLGLGQWMDGSIAYYLQKRKVYYAHNPSCGALHIGFASLGVRSCHRRVLRSVLCEDVSKVNKSHVQRIRLANPGFFVSSIRHVLCPANHTTHNFLACDVRSECWSRGSRSTGSCLAPLTPLPPSMMCSSGVEYVQYTLVCDFRSDCSDDEQFCVYPKCTTLQRQCHNKQCVRLDQWCDGMDHCIDRSDEIDCGRRASYRPKSIPSPAVVYMHGRGRITIEPLTGSASLSHNLQKLSLAGNPLTSLFERHAGTDYVATKMWALDLFRVYIGELKYGIFKTFPNLQTLNLSETRLGVVPEYGFGAFTQLRVLDLRGCPVYEFSPDVFE